MKKFTVLLVITFILNSCVASMQKVPLSFREYNGVKEGTIFKDLGEPLIIKGVEKYTKAIKLQNSINENVLRQSGKSYEVDLRNGEVLYYGGYKGNEDFYFSNNEISSGVNKYIQGVSIDKSSNKKSLFFTQNIYGYFFKKEFEFKYSETEYSENLCSECLKKELIYNGRSGNEIKVIYREFVDNMARPAFTQNLSYDLSEGDEISFKGCRLKVLNAKNTGIEYIILSGFNE